VYKLGNMIADHCHDASAPGRHAKISLLLANKREQRTFNGVVTWTMNVILTARIDVCEMIALIFLIVLFYLIYAPWKTEHVGIDPFAPVISPVLWIDACANAYGDVRNRRHDISNYYDHFYGDGVSMLLMMWLMNQIHLDPVALDYLCDFYRVVMHCVAHCLR